MNDSQLREVYSAADTQQAHLIKLVLDDAGIESRVVGDHLQGAVGDLPAIAIAPRIWVRQAEYDRARQIIAELEKRETGTVSWTCSQCGETNEPSFDLCWKCQTSRSTD